MTTKKVTISLTPEQQENARVLSVKLFGKPNISGYIGYLIQAALEKSKNSSRENSKNSH